MREELPSFSPAIAVESALSAAGFHRTELALSTVVQAQIGTETERPQRDVSRDPERRQALGRLTRFVRFFEERHFEVRWMRRSLRRQKRRPTAASWLTLMPFAQAGFRANRSRSRDASWMNTKSRCHDSRMENWLSISSTPRLTCCADCA